MQDIGGFEPRTTELVGALDVRWTSAQRGAKIESQMKNLSNRDVFLMQDIGGFEHRTTELVGALDVQWTSAQRGPKRSEERIPDVSL